MARSKIDYGIDLGTTNSAICRMENGVPLIIKSDTLADTTPSCVTVTPRKQILVGATARNAMIAGKRRATKKWEAYSEGFLEFKRKMGTDETFYSQNMQHTFTPEELSAEVLKKLRSYVTDEDVPSVVITVPAKFSTTQTDATMRAARLAGFEHCALLQEPIAACMAYGMRSEDKDGCWVVCDLGGGTFDIALVRVEDGILKVFDTAGDNYLGGKNLDYAIVDQILIPYLKENYSITDILANQTKRMILRDALKTYAEPAKIELSFKPATTIETQMDELGTDDNGQELEIFLDLTREQLAPVIEPYFQRATDMILNLLKQNNIDPRYGVSSLILVGGPTFTPLFRQMLIEQITPRVNHSIDPMTAVATGAALYASTLDNDVKPQTQAGTISLTLHYKATTVEPTELVTVKLNAADNAADIPSGLMFEITRSDGGWTSGKLPLNAQGEIAECQLLEGKPNAFNVRVFTSGGVNLPCLPDSISIIQGMDIGSAILPYSIGIETWNPEKKVAVFTAIKGLEKNQNLPATGIINGLKSTADIRPGNSEDYLKIPIYESGDDNAENVPAVFSQYLYEARLTGRELPKLLPRGSEVNVSVNVDTSRRITMSVDIPVLDITKDINVPRDTVQKRVSADYLNGELNKARAHLLRLGMDDPEAKDISKELGNIQRELQNGDEWKQVLDHLRHQLRRISLLEDAGAWDRAAKDLKSKMTMLRQDNDKYGNADTTAQVEHYQKQTEAVLASQDPGQAKILADQIEIYDIKLARIEYFEAWISGWNSNFEHIQWKDRTRARSLIDRGMEILTDAPDAERLGPIVSRIIDELPPSKVPSEASGLLEK